MQSATLDELGWIHDCPLLTVLYDTSSAGQSIRLTILCPPDLGYEPWNGRKLVIVAGDVAISKQVVFGVAGPETIDAIRPGISAAVRESTLEARQKGVRFPTLEFTVSFHSGSGLEVICKALHVDVCS